MAILRGAARRAVAAVGGALIGSAAVGIVYFDADIKILKAEGTPAITVQYTGAKAARVEIRVNGASVGDRSLDAAKSAGEVRFSIALDSLRQGENVIEAALFDASGRLLGSQKTTFVAQKSDKPPVFIHVPKMGDTVQGTIEIRVDFGIQMRDAYVSFFVDKQFRAMRNFPPYAYWWDTSRASNGWHEIEAWSFDNTQTTRKSTPVRVLVNNPGGRTERARQTVTGPTIRPETGRARELKDPTRPSEVGPLGPAVLGSPTLRPPMGGPAGEKSSVPLHAEVTGARVSDPAAGGTPKLGLKRVKVGTRLGFEGAYGIYFNEQPVRFDVPPRVQDGVPLTPFRHLYEHAGGEVGWIHLEKVCTAGGLGYDIWIKIGNLAARVNGNSVELEVMPFIEQGRTIVPLSFIEETLAVDVQFDPNSGHVLITRK